MARLRGSRVLPLVLAAWLAGGCSSPADSKERAGSTAGVEEFLDDYDARFQSFSRESNEAEWKSNVRIVEGDDTNAKRTRAANEAKAAFTGSVENIEKARGFLARRERLTDLQARRLERVLFEAGAYPQTAADLVKERIAAETAQTEALYGFSYKIDGKPVTTNDIDRVLREEKDLAKRRAAWEASKQVGPTLRDGLIRLRELRNRTVQALGYADFFAYQASEYGMTTDELMDRIDAIQRELRPLFRELHTWARHELARRHGQPVPDLIPAHWLPNRWGQDWSAMVDAPGLDLDGALASRSPEWIVQQAERFYVSLGFEPLPATFWEKSSLYPAPPGSAWKKNNHASAWHIDFARDVRSLMSVEPNTEWYETTHHELGHIYYDLAYSSPSVPIVLRQGANRAYHEAVGSLMGLAAMQPRFIAASGVAAPSSRPDSMQLLLKEALNYVVFVPFSAGTMTRFERDLYAGALPANRWNSRWWELAARYQGIAPPEPRDERWCDAATKTHINDDAAQYYDYAMSYVLLFQLHDHIAKSILREDPHDTNYYGRKDVGDFLRSILSPGATVDGRALLREKTGEDLSARAMVEYFEPLRAWLAKENDGRKHTLAEL